MQVGECSRMTCPARLATGWQLATFRQTIDELVTATSGQPALRLSSHAPCVREGLNMDLALSSEWISISFDVFDFRF